MTNYGAYLEKLTEEFPKFDLKKKSESKLMKFLSLLLKIISFGNMKNFMDKYITTIGYTVYVPDGWANKPDDDKIIILRHEAVHMRQRERLGFVLMSLIYLFFIIPVVFAIGRATLEREAYKETIKATAELKSKELATGMRMREYFVRQFTSANYLWMFPFKGIVNSWFDKIIEEI